MNTNCCVAFDAGLCTQSTKAFSDFALDITKLCAGELVHALQSTATKEIVGYAVGGGVIGIAITANVVYFKYFYKKEKELPRFFIEGGEFQENTVLSTWQHFESH